MIDELSRDPFISTEQTENVINTTLDYLRDKLSPLWMYNRMLDIGRESPLSITIREHWGLRIYNTEGDLDIIELQGNKIYDYILYSHTIEHQFNPLHTLLELKKVMAPHTTMFIILPNKPKFLWWDGHYHEIDRYRMGLLLKRAGLRIISYERHRAWRKWSFYLKGIRPFIRLFCEYNDYYEVKL